MAGILVGVGLLFWIWLLALEFAVGRYAFTDNVRCDEPLAVFLLLTGSSSLAYVAFQIILSSVYDFFSCTELDTFSFFFSCT